MSLTRRWAALLYGIGLSAAAACNPAPQAGTPPAPAAGNATPPALARLENIAESWRFRSDTNAASAPDSRQFASRGTR